MAIEGIEGLEELNSSSGGKIQSSAVVAFLVVGQ